MTGHEMIWSDPIHGQFCRFALAWDEGLAIAAEAEAGSPKALAMQAVAGKAIAGDSEARRTVIAWVEDLKTKILAIEEFNERLAGAGLSLAQMAAAIQKRFSLSDREAVHAARRIKRDHLPPKPGTLAQWRRRDVQEEGQ